MMADSAIFGVGKKGVNVVSIEGRLMSADAVESADLYVDIKVKDAQGRDVRLVSSAQLLKNEADKQELSQYSEQCGIPVDEIRTIARKFTPARQESCGCPRRRHVQQRCRNVRLALLHSQHIDCQS